MADVDGSKAAIFATLAGELVAAAEGRAREEVAQRLVALFMSADKERRESVKPLQVVQFAAVPNLYALNPSADACDVRDQLSAKLSQLVSMLTITTGEGFESFDRWSDEIRENYLWSCAQAARECEALAPLAFEGGNVEMERAEA